MSPDYWQKIKLILDEALVQTPTARSEYLAAACGANRTLRRDVESLLAFENTDGDALEAAAFAAIGDLPVQENDCAGKTFGAYKTLEKLGEGGMGAVFLAERDDGEFRQRVAVKVIRSGINSDAVLRRFLNERQILAELEHPNIARLIDGGTSQDGTPYLVMEYVEGAPVDHYADARDLSVPERLDLFRRVCAAVAYAHKNLIIHRDLKPSNILVAEDGTPKLLDFGIAKLLKVEDSNETQTRQLAFTPDYASPEQVRGEKLTTATDVYSLGVILYELLTGARPYQTDSRNFGEVLRLVCETEPERPSSVVRRPLSVVNRLLSVDANVTAENEKQTTKEEQKAKDKAQRTNPKLLRGDLDNIVLKALRKEPERRYSSVEQLSEDIRRHLAGLPVAARQDTWNYRAGKFVRRNRFAVGFAALVVLALVSGITTTAWQARRAERERALAERRFENLRKMSNSISSEIHNAIRDLPGSLPARQLLMTRAVEQLDALAEEAEGNRALQADLASAYQNLGVLPDKPVAERREIFLKSAAMYRRILDDQPNDVNARMQLAQCYFNLADLSRLQSDLAAALDYNRQSILLVESVMRDEPGEVKHQVQFWGANYNFALSLYQAGNAAEAVATLRKVLPVAESLRTNNPTGTDRYNYVRPQQTRSVIAESLSYAGDYENAVEEFEATVAVCQIERALKPNDTIIARNLAITHSRMAAAVEYAGDADTALQHLQTSASMLEKLVAENPKNYDFPTYLAHTEVATGQFFLRRNQAEKAVAHFRRAIELNESILAADALRGQNRMEAARSRSNLGHALVLTGKSAEGLRHLREAIQFYESANASRTIDALLKRHFAEACAYLATALAKNKTTENLAEARASYGQSLELWSDLQRQGLLRHSDALQPAEISRRLAELNEAQSN